ncbi:MAG TPA: hypothetical protein VK158_03475 [Acidobacteriota bacterium]|nr:hypothetical protein [Acidobacteriota bacterium]
MKHIPAIGIALMLVMLLFLLGCQDKMEYSDNIEYCQNFSTQETCDTSYCDWRLQVECAVPGNNCGVAYTGIPECLPKKNP